MPISKQGISVVAHPHHNIWFGNLAGPETQVETTTDSRLESKDQCCTMWSPIWVWSCHETGSMNWMLGSNLASWFSQQCYMLFAVWRNCHSWSTILCMCTANLTIQGSCTLGLAPWWLMVMQPVNQASLPTSQEYSLVTWLLPPSISLTGSKQWHFLFFHYE
jgi:hypothetical protein